jgi:hypothetical protein
LAASVRDLSQAALRHFVSLVKKKKLRSTVDTQERVSIFGPSAKINLAVLSARILEIKVQITAT